MKTKVSQKNKNIINIKINTEKKAKNNRRKRAKPSGSGKSSYNSGYSVTPPIII
jgi:formate dehydrogenase assembly factor FdhD